MAGAYAARRRQMTILKRIMRSHSSKRNRKREQALALHCQGRADEAARVRLGQGCADAAEALLRRATMAARSSAEAHGNLAAALQALAATKRRSRITDRRLR